MSAWRGDPILTRHTLPFRTSMLMRRPERVEWWSRSAPCGRARQTPFLHHWRPTGDRDTTHWAGVGKKQKTNSTRPACTASDEWSWTNAIPRDFFVSLSVRTLTPCARARARTRDDDAPTRKQSRAPPRVTHTHARDQAHPPPRRVITHTHTHAAAPFSSEDVARPLSCRRFRSLPRLGSHASRRPRDDASSRAMTDPTVCARRLSPECPWRGRRPT